MSGALRRLGVVLLGSAAVVTLAPSVAFADYEPATIVSASESAQANDVSRAIAVSADGRYAVFISRATNLFSPADRTGPNPKGGIFRKDLQTGQLDLVELNTGTDVLPGSGELYPSAMKPSISADGRFVAFVTNRSLSVNDANTSADAYVRDMSVPIDDPGAYDVVSARNGSATALRYGTGFDGVITTPKSISADGQRVAFAVLLPSNLGNGGTTTSTPAGQVAVRDRATHRTYLASLDRKGGPAQSQFPSAFDKNVAIALSADGSTVAWYAFTASEQVDIPASIDSVQQPLWRKLDGSDAHTRLITGAADPDDPACARPMALTNNATPSACDGPLGGDVSGAQQTLALSADGDRSLLAIGPLRGIGGSSISTELFDVDMAPGLSRKTATTRLTAGSTIRATSGLSNASLSSDGNYAAFVAKTWQPTIVPPTPTGTFVSSTRPQAFLINFRAGTIEAISAAFNGGELNGAGVSDVDVSDNGRVVALGVPAATTNFFFGDANGVGDVAVRKLIEKPTGSPFVEVPPAAPSPAPIAREQRMTVTAKSLASGQVRVIASLPDRGVLSLIARRRVEVRRAGKKIKTQPQVATAVRKTVDGEQVLTLLLSPIRKYARQVRRDGGVGVDLSVAFTTSSGQLLTKQIATTMARTAKATGREAHR